MTVTGEEEYSVNYVYNNVNWLIESTKITGEQEETTVYKYDDNGNQIIKNISTVTPLTLAKAGIKLETGSSYIEIYKYNSNNQLIESNVEGVKAEYSYKVNGLRYSKTVDGVETTHIWDGSNIVADMKGGEIATEHIRGIGLLASKEGGNYKTYLYNGHGDVVQLASESGEVLWRYDYGAFGVEKDIEGQDKALDQNPFRYCAEYFDKETGTIYLRARYYNPATGRFTQQDPIRDSLNWYTYANNNPIRYIDPMGLAAGKIHREQQIMAWGNILKKPDRNSKQKTSYVISETPQCFLPPYSNDNLYDIDSNIFLNDQTIEIPQEGELGTLMTYMGWHKITNKTSPQYQLLMDARESGRYSISVPEYYGLIDGKISIATRKEIGGILSVKVGDYVDVTFRNSDDTLTVYNCIIGDIKGDDADSPWGHQGGKCITEILYHDYNPSDMYNRNKNNPWGSGRTYSIEIVGNYYE